MEIPIEDITILPTRPLNKDMVTKLAESIKEGGLDRFICVTPYKKKYRLVDGLHRLEACKQAGMKTIQVQVIG